MWIDIPNLMHNSYTGINYWTSFIQSRHQAILIRAIPMGFKMKFYCIKITLINFYPHPCLLYTSDAADE